jgi:hypothetical protein
MFRSRLSIALGLALIVGAFSAAPASAATVIDACSGTCGTYSVTDKSGGPYGAICKYETGSYDLDWIKVSPPKMYGTSSSPRQVQWKFNILRSTNFGGSYTGIFNSSWQTDTATSAAAANGFTSRTWYASDPNPTGYFKVRILLWWKNAGSGYSKMKVEYDFYQRKWNGNSNPSTDYCLQDW